CTLFSQAEIFKNPTDSITIKAKRDTLPRSIDTSRLPGNSGAAASIVHRLLEKEISPLGIALNRMHNGYIQAYMERYTSEQYRAHLSEMLGLATYYFPIFERILGEKRVPREIKYLAIVESSLNPHAVSPVGATGPWQFMYATAKGYGLTINSYVDERKDPFEATYAAANYLKQSYDVYGDWLLAIASYNCGQGNVNRAINRSGIDNPTFWDIQSYLPTETRNYVPAFIAMSYVM